MALSVPAIAWLKQAALLLLLVAVAVVGLAIVHLAALAEVLGLSLEPSREPGRGQETQERRLAPVL